MSQHYNGAPKGAGYLSTALDADVLFFEWPGTDYSMNKDGELLKSFCCGCSCTCMAQLAGSCSASEDWCREGFEAVFDFATAKIEEGGLGVLSNRVVVYGASLGSALAVDFVSEMEPSLQAQLGG